MKVGLRRIGADEVAEVADRVAERTLPWRDKRKVFVDLLANRHGLKAADVSKAARDIWPPWTTTQLLKKLRSRAFLAALDAPSDLVEPGWPLPATGPWVTRSGPGSRAYRPPTAMSSWTRPRT